MSKITKTGEQTKATTVATLKVSTSTTTPAAPYTITKRIGGTTYEVVVHFSNTSKETISDKITRLIQRESFIGKAAGQ